MYLLDTNILSKLRHIGTNKENSCLAGWQNGVNPAELFISALTVMELERGILSLIRKDSFQGERLMQWFERQVLAAFTNDRILAFDTAVARTCAKLHVPDPKPLIDAQIAATAVHHNLTLVTDNVKDFKTMPGLRVFNPCV